MRAIFQQTILMAFRDRFFTIFLIAIAAIILLSAFLGDQSLIEKDETGFTLAAFSIRLIIVIGSALFAIVTLNSTMKAGEFYIQLSRPISRASIVIAYLAAFWAIATILTLFAAIAIALTMHLDLYRLAIWSACLIMEAGVLLSFSIFAIVGLKSITAAFSFTVLFYVLARMIGVLIALAGSTFRERSSLFDIFLDKICNALGLLLPRLDLFSSAWLEYGVPAHTGAILFMQMITYVALLLACAIFDLNRKHF